ncbi:MAG: FumA C-terminus/TtdB family hydratase beta subunit [Oscillospiraceae bacterium]|nr:FumA C-terminus/TtdB family hydratase beta subunit [Oscillospiraceae bacterium]
MGEYRELTTPLSDETIRSLRSGDMIYITGTVYTARDAAHQRMSEMLAAGQDMPFEFDGNIVFYAGPSPTQPGMVIGSIGPTTAGRMDSFAPALIARGLKVMIAKGFRSDAVKKAIMEHGGVYLAGVGGIAALMSQCVKSEELVAFEDLGPEAIRKLEVEKLPVVVALDSAGNDVYDRGNK